MADSIPTTKPWWPNLHPCLLLLLFLAGSFLAVSLGTQLNPDGILYFSYLRSAFFDHDLLLVNEFNEFDLLSLSRHVSATGLEGNPVAIGTPILMAPFYAIAFSVDWLSGLIGITLGDDGYRGIYALVFPFGSLFYGCLTGLMILKLLRNYYHHDRAELTLLHIMLGTPFLFYLAVHYHVSHLSSTFSVTLLVYVLEKIRSDTGLVDKYRPFLVMGAVSGVALLVRTQNGLFWIIPFCSLMFRLRQTGNFRRIFLQGVCFLGGAAAAFSPQLMVWKILHGRWVHAPEAANLNFLNLNLLQTLTSSYHGLFFWSPILILSVLGLVLLARRDWERGAPLLLAVLLQLAVNASMRMWWEGGSFGLRLFVNCTPLFAIGLAAVYTRIKARWIRVLGGLFVFWTFLLYLNVVTDKIDLNRYYPASEIIRCQARQLLGWFDPAVLMARLEMFSSGGEAFLLTATVVLTIMMLKYLPGVFPPVSAGRTFPVLGLTGIILAGPALSGLIYGMGITSHHHKQYWQKDLKQIEGRLNSYKLFYIDYSFYIMHAEYLKAVGRESQAIKEYIKAIRIYPRPDLYLSLTNLLLKGGYQRQARQVIQQARFRWPDNTDIIKQSERLSQSLRLSP